MNDPYHLLVRAAHLPGNLHADQAFAEAADSFQDWDSIVLEAERHSLAPLLYTHLRQLDTTIPANVKLQLQGLFLRHQRANDIRLSRLAKILTILDTEKIPVIVLKGAALAHVVYPAPALRPMKDLDILVSPQQAEQVQEILRNSGFSHAMPDDPTPEDHHHLPVIMEETAEMAVSVEVHRSLGGTPLYPEVRSFADVWKTAVVYPFNEQKACMLGYEDMLWHFYTHMMAEPARLVRIVDLVGFAEKFSPKINWETVRRQTPQLIPALSVLHFVIPLSPQLRATAGIPQGQAPSGADVMLQGWPPLPHLWPGKSLRRILQETFFPTDACLRLYYGVPVDRSITSYRWWHHPAQVFAWYFQWRKIK